MDFTPRRVLLFLVLSAVILVTWRIVVVPNLMMAPPPVANQDEEEKPEDTPPEDEKSPAKVPADTPPAMAQKPGETAVADVKPEQPKKPSVENKEEVYPKKDVILGSLDEEKSGYFYQVTITSLGAAVTTIELNDPRYRNLEDQTQPLTLTTPIVKPSDKRLNEDDYYRTFAVSSAEISKLLPGSDTLETVNWKLVDASESKAIFEYPIPGKFKITKTYTLEKSEVEEYSENIRDTELKPYMLSMDLTVENLQAETQTLSYDLQGPVGMPLENAESTRKFRDIKLGTLNGESINHQSLTSKDLAKTVINEGEEEVEEWKAPFRYLGVDGQFFATLFVQNSEDGLSTDQIAEYTPQAVDLVESDPQMSGVSVLLTSKEIKLDSKGTVTHKYTLYAGPKRQGLLREFDAEDIMEFGWFGWISKGMLAVLSFLHNSLFLPYGLAIIGLTILVRGALFPLSKKQAHSAGRMKELQPKLQELKKKYGDDKQKFAQAQMDLFRDAGYNPFAGCMPMLLQLPIFIGLYSALSHAVDLRSASFLWVDDLASPDKLFQWPFGVDLPFLGRNFNLLPILTVGLFLMQQKMFMPTPDPDDEQAVIQHKVMNFMMIFMGFLFYHVPAGLCIYFIASSMWGIGERKLLEKAKEGNTDESTADAVTADNGWAKSESQKGKNTASKKRGKKSKTRR